MDGCAVRTVFRRSRRLSTYVADWHAALGLFTATTTLSEVSGHPLETGVRRRSYTSRVPNETPSVNRAEAAKFAKLSSKWWDPNGPFKPLHAMNKARCEFIKGVMDEYVEESGGSASKDAQGRCSVSIRMDTEDAVDRRMDEKRIIRVLDVGCGGGILSESLATMPLKDPNIEVRVLGIDVNKEGIDTAEEHRRTAHPGLPAARLSYRAVTVEDLLDEKLSSSHTDESDSGHGVGVSSDLQANTDQAADASLDLPGAFDIVIASEVIEHVDHPQVFCRNLIRATAPGGRVIISTLNRTVKSYGLAILGAETLLRIVPEGTHDWSKFLTPEEIVFMMTESGSPALLDTMAGMVFNPLTGLWTLADDVDVNYITSFAVL